jgi:hypothetical protein
MISLEILLTLIFVIISVMERKIYNPIQKDTVTFLKTSADTNGEST